MAFFLLPSSSCLLAIGLSLAIVLGSPYIGQIRQAVQDAVPNQYRTIVGTAVVGGVLGALAFALTRIRERRRLRYLCLAGAVLLGVLYANASRTGNADQDLVEQFHFVEYGLVTLVFYRVWRGRDDVGMLVLPICSAIIVGIADEWVQWFIPSRVGELHDVLINAVAAVCGVLFSVGVDPPRGVAMPHDRHARRMLAAAISVVLLAGGVFVDAVHMGYRVTQAGVGTFLSTFNADTLRSTAASRAAEWAVRADIAGTGLSREDHYLREGLWHVGVRNEALGDGDVTTAWNENLILETFYAPVLGLGLRWPPDQQAQIEKSAIRDASSYVSDAEPYPIFTFSRWWLWTGTALAVAFVWAAAERQTHPRGREARV
jgi:VanZ family protein